MAWLKNSEPRCFACYAELRPGPKASAPTGHCCHHLRACGFPAGIADCLARKSSRERAARAKRMFSGPCSRPRDAIAKRSRFTVPFLVTDPHTKFQRLATNSARGGRPRIPTQFDFNIIIGFWLLSIPIQFFKMVFCSQKLSAQNFKHTGTYTPPSSRSWIFVCP